MTTATTSLQSLVNAKAALDLGLLTAEDYGRVKEAFLKAQELRAGIDAGLIEEGAQVAQAREGFVEMVLSHRSNETGSRAVAPKAAASVAHPLPPMPAAAATSKAPAPPPPPVPPKAPPSAPPPPPMAPTAPVAPALPMASSATTSQKSSRSASPGKLPKHATANAGTSMSGISISQDAVEVFYQMRLKSTYRWVVYKINDAATEVVIEHLGAPTSTYGEFLAHLPESDCRYAVYDYNFMGRDGQEHSKLCFINWAPDVAKVKSKMMFASTKDFFKGSLEGLSLEFQGSEVEDVVEDVVGEAVRALKKY